MHCSVWGWNAIQPRIKWKSEDGSSLDIWYTINSILTSRSSIYFKCLCVCGWGPGWTSRKWQCEVWKSYYWCSVAPSVQLTLTTTRRSKSRSWSRTSDVHVIRPPHSWRRSSLSHLSYATVTICMLGLDLYCTSCFSFHIFVWSLIFDKLKLSIMRNRFY